MTIVLILTTVGWSDILALINSELCMLPDILGPKHAHLSEVRFEPGAFCLIKDEQ
jgi:hypothetical protein